MPMDPTLPVALKALTDAELIREWMEACRPPRIPNLTRIRVVRAECEARGLVETVNKLSADQMSRLTDKGRQVVMQAQNGQLPGSEALTPDLFRELIAALEAVTNHLARVMGGPMVTGAGVTFTNGVEGTPRSRLPGKSWSGPGM